jgi:hypothetical protein
MWFLDFSVDFFSAWHEHGMESNSTHYFLHTVFYYIWGIFGCLEK